MKDYRRVLVFGHSFVHGLWDDERGGWFERLRQSLYRDYLDNHCSHWDENYCNLYNLGVTSETSEGLKKRIADELEIRCKKNRDQNLVIIQTGLNDAQLFESGRKVSKEQFRDNMNDIVGTAKDYASKVILIGEGYVPAEIDDKVIDGELSDEILKSYSDIEAEVAEENDIEFIDLRQKFTRGEWIEKLQEGVHPNSRGHELIFTAVKENLESEGLI